jgi:hypothetical protein
MSTRFNRNDANVSSDRLFPADFQVDQNGQDADILQLAKDLGCLPCLGSGLDVTSKSEVDHKVEVAAGWAYDVDGRRITISSTQEVVLTDTAGGNNYIILSHAYVTDTARPAHRTGTSYDTRKKDSFQLTVSNTSPGVNDIVLANCTQTGTGTITIELADRLVTSCRMIAQSMIPEVTEEDAGGAPPGQQNELPDYPKGRTIPMPIILQGTRNGESWSGIETILPENLGRTTAAISTLTLERVNLKSGTALADVKVWVGDWGQGQRDAVNSAKCNFTMPTKSGVSAWDDNLWITSPPGYYYLVKDDESWFSKITDSGDTWVECSENLPDAVSGTYYICPYAELYRTQTFPYESDAVLQVTHPHTLRHYNRIASPVAPVALIKDLNLGGKYKIKVASVITGDNYTKWAEQDFVVGSDILVCWEAASSNLTVTPVDGGVEVSIPGISSGDTPETYEVCYVYGADPDTLAAPDFTDDTHATIHTSERVFKLDVPPGKAVKVAARAIKSRMVMRCAGLDKIVAQSGDYVTAGGVGLRRNRKSFTGVINEANVAASSAELADHVPLPNAVWPEKIFLFNNTASSQSDFEVYVHGANQPYADGRKISIGTGGDYPSLASKSSGEVTISDFKITDAGMKITVKNTDTGPQTINLNYGVQYREDSPLQRVGATHATPLR